MKRDYKTMAEDIIAAIALVATILYFAVEWNGFMWADVVERKS